MLTLTDIRNKLIVCPACNGDGLDQSQDRVWNKCYCCDDNLEVSVDEITVDIFYNFLKYITEKFDASLEDLTCYDPINHTCDGRCQGASDCLLARYYSEIEETPTKEDMMIYELDSALKQKEYDKIFQDEPFKGKLKSIIDDFKKTERKLDKQTRKVTITLDVDSELDRTQLWKSITEAIELGMDEQLLKNRISEYSHKKITIGRFKK